MKHPHLRTYETLVHVTEWDDGRSGLRTFEAYASDVRSLKHLPLLYPV